jgi:hypothetical protein
MLKAVRLTHMYLGVFLAPSLLFFAFTGALQTFSLHESHMKGYTPPLWLLHLSQMHKNQTFWVPRRPVPPSAAPAIPKPAPASKPAAATPTPVPKPAAATPPMRDLHAPSPMKFFFVFVALGLFTTTLLGVYMSYKYNRNKFAVTATLIAGIVIPGILSFF